MHDCYTRIIELKIANYYKMTSHKNLKKIEIALSVFGQK